MKRALLVVVGMVLLQGCAIMRPAQLEGLFPGDYSGGVAVEEEWAQ